MNDPVLYRLDARPERDARGRAIPNIQVADGDWWMLDLEPLANWAHDVLYICRNKGGGLVTVRHDWPPCDAVIRTLVQGGLS